MNYCFYSLCIPVGGFLRTAVYDLQRNDYFFVNNGVKGLITNTGITERISQLLEERAVFEKPQGLDFSSISPGEYDYPAIISNAIIEVDGTKTIAKLLDHLDVLQCRNVQWIFKGQAKYLRKFLEESYKRIQNSLIKYCEIVCSEQDFYSVQDLLTREKFPELGLIYLHSAAASRYFIADPIHCPIICFDSNFNYNIQQNNKSIYFFTVNYLLYTESLLFNSYYNRKIFINLRGDVSAGPLCSSESLGNLSDSEFTWGTVLDNQKLKELWRINKDKITVCKNCEFRYMCVDSRIPKEHLNEKGWYHDSECNYNPFIAKWKGEPGYKTLLESGVKVSETGISIDYEALKSILSDLYS